MITPKNVVLLTCKIDSLLTKRFNFNIINLGFVVLIDSLFKFSQSTILFISICNCFLKYLKVGMTKVHSYHRQIRESKQFYYNFLCHLCIK